MAEPTPIWGGWEPDVRDDPFPHFAAMRAQCPVQPVRLADGHDAWLVLGHDAARQALNDPRISKDMLAALAADPEVVAEGLPGPGVRAAHAGRRSARPHPAAPPRGPGVRARRGSRRSSRAIERIADDLLDDARGRRARRVVDLVAGFAFPLPFRVICELLGVPEADRRTARTLVPRPAPAVERPRRRPRRSRRPTASSAYLADLVDGTSGEHPATTSSSVLVDASDGDERLTDQELLSSLFQLIVAGHDTTTSLIGNGVVALLDHPDQLALLRADPSRCPRRVEELLRYDAPVPHATFRVHAEPVELGGVDDPRAAAGDRLPRRRQPRPERPSPTRTARPRRAPRPPPRVRPRHPLLPRRAARPAGGAASRSRRCSAASPTSASPFP